MGVDFFPNEMNSSQAGPHPKRLFTYRLIALVVIAVIFVFYSIGDLQYFFYSSDWGVALTLFYFISVVLGKQVKQLDKINCVFFQVIWAYNWAITLVYWLGIIPFTSYSLDAIITHTAPIVLTILDYLQNKIVFVRIQYIAAAIVLLLYLSTFSTIFPEVLSLDFLIFCLIIIAFAAGILELGKFVKRQLDKNGKLGDSLL